MFLCRYFLSPPPRARERVKSASERGKKEKQKRQRKRDNLRKLSPLVVEVADLRGEVGRELGRVEAVDRADVRRAREQLVVERVDVVAEARGDAHSRDDDARGGVGARGDGGGADGDGAGCVGFGGTGEGEGGGEGGRGGEERKQWAALAR